MCDNVLITYRNAGGVVENDQVKEGSGPVLPGTFTDFVKALRELVGLANDVRELAGSGVRAFERSRRRRAGRDLDVLSFGPDQSRNPLERIAEGNGTEEDFDAIKASLARSTDSVEQSISRLDVYRDQLREEFGLAAANKLAEIVRGECGKVMIRMQMTILAQKATEGAYSPEKIQRDAKLVLHSIEQLNVKLVELHDLVVQPKGAA